MSDSQATNSKTPWAIGGSLTGLAATIVWSQLQVLQNQIDTNQKEVAELRAAISDRDSRFQRTDLRLSETITAVAELRSQAQLGVRFTASGDALDVRDKIREIQKQIDELKRGR